MSSARGDDFDMDFVSLAFEQILHRVGDTSAERLEGVALNVQALDVGVLDIPDAGLIIVNGFDYGNAHFPIPQSAATT
jgi:hypothetical protein